MKNLLYFPAVTLFVIALLLSCSKDGVYNPSKKIKSIEKTSITVYDGDTIDRNYRKEIWTWQKRLLSKMDIEENGVASTLHFTYQNNHISKISSDNYTVNYQYDNKKLQTIVYDYGDDKMIVTIEKRDNTFLLLLKYQILGSRWAHDYIFKNSFGFIDFPTTIVRQNRAISERMMSKANSDTLTFTASLLYNTSDNIKGLTITLDDNNIYNYHFTYDEKNNPYYENFMNLVESSNIAWFSSPNNITAYNEDKTPTEITSLSYQYDKKNKWPVSYTQKRISTPEFPSLYYSEEYVKIDY